MSDRSPRSILSDQPTIRSPEGALFILVAGLAFVACILAVEALALPRPWTFTAGILFVLVFEPLRARLATRVADREALLEEVDQ